MNVSKMDKITRSSLDLFLIMIIIIAYLSLRNQACLLKRRPQAFRGGFPTWSLPYAEKCSCQFVVAPRSSSVCSENEYVEDDLWFIDDPQVLIMRHNWEKVKLDELLERTDYCADECKDGIDTCDNNALCIDTLGSYTCQCKTGYSGDGMTCIGVDECADDTDTECAVNAHCYNTDDSFTCQCHVGYIGDGNTCTDVDECVDDNDLCAVNADCYNTDGSYTCQCHVGYIGDGYNCTDVDECADDTDTCADNADCDNTDGSYTCQCHTGYIDDGGTCTDVDECADDIYTCSVNADCYNTDGSYTCQCLAGYIDDGYNNCTDVDECADDIDTCSGNTICENNDGSYSCQCHVGYIDDGGTCTDVDECADGTDTCSANANCYNNDGSYNCYCHLGYNGDGHNCTAGILGMEAGSIADSQIIASSAPNMGKLAYHGRLNYPDFGFWHSDNVLNDANPWIMIDFLTPMHLVGIITQGGCDESQPGTPFYEAGTCGISGWVYTVKIETATTGLETATFISENGNHTIFDANIDADDHNDQAVIMFPETIDAPYIRIYPISYKWGSYKRSSGNYASAAMRLEILGERPQTLVG